MSDFKTEYPVLYFNEYFKRKPMRLNERESEELFTLEETDVNNFEYISLHDHEKEIASLKEQLKREQDCVDFYANGENWSYVNQYNKTLMKMDKDIEWISPGNFTEKFAGKLARSTQERREK